MYINDTCVLNEINNHIGVVLYLFKTNTYGLVSITTYLTYVLICYLIYVSNIGDSEDNKFDIEE